jgi:pimeloyl-ACP methyl ester carboxylesterase
LSFLDNRIRDLGKTMPKCIIPSGTLEYLEAGRGTPLILMHGGTGSIGEWDACIDAFASRYCVLAYDRRGYGRSTPRATFSLDFFDEDIEDLVAFLDALALSEPPLFCAFSDGGTIALMFAARFPERVRALVCVGAHIYVEEKSLRGLAHARQAFERRIKEMDLEDLPQTRSQRAWFERWLGSDFTEYSIEHEISNIRCPTLIVQGTEDEYAEISHAQRIADGIKDSDLWLVKGARHWVHRGEHVDEFVERVLGFLSDK